MNLHINTIIIRKHSQIYIPDIIIIYNLEWYQDTFCIVAFLYCEVTTGQKSKTFCVMLVCQQNCYLTDISTGMLVFACCLVILAGFFPSIFVCIMVSRLFVINFQYFVEILNESLYVQLFYANVFPNLNKPNWHNKIWSQQGLWSEILQVPWTRK